MTWVLKDEEFTRLSIKGRLFWAEGPVSEARASLDWWRVALTRRVGWVGSGGKGKGEEVLPR